MSQTVLITHYKVFFNLARQFEITYNMKFIVLVTCIFFSMHQSSADRTFSRCDLARELMRQGFSRSSLPNWVCLVEAESSRRTAIIGPTNNDGSRDYGLFQINNKVWCKNGTPGNKCGLTCESVITDDITAACSCAKKIFNESGFGAWVGWKNKCRGKTLPNLGAECGI